MMMQSAFQVASEKRIHAGNTGLILDQENHQGPAAW